MTNAEYKTLQRGYNVYFVRVIPKLDIYELLDLHIVSIYDEYCTGVNSKTKQTFLFSKKEFEEVLYFDRKEALECLNQIIEESNGRKE